MKISRLFFKFIMVVCYAAVILLSVELLNRYGIFSTPAAFPLSVVFIILLYVIFYGLTGRLTLSVSLVNGGLYLIYMLNYYRLMISSLPFQPNDFLMISKTNQILTMIDLKISWEMAVSLATVIIATLIFRKFYDTDVNDYRGRMVLFSSSLALFLAIFSTNAYFAPLSNPLNGTIIERYEKNGVALGFYMSILSKEEKSVAAIEYGPSGSETPVSDEELPVSDEESVGFVEQIMNGNVEYSEEFMKDIVDYIKGYCKSKKFDDTVKPNVVVIMSEAFTDPTRWPNVEFSTDPASNFHALEQTAITGKIVTPAFGGSTCDPEFEFLTGNAMRYVNSGDTPFTLHETYIPDYDDRSLANQFKQNGYDTIGLHTFGGSTYYPRTLLYPRLGFNTFIAKEDMDPDGFKYKGYLGEQILSDEYFTDRIIEILDKGGEGGKPVFLYGISMQNHFQYFETKYRPEDYDLTLSSDKLSTPQNGYAHAYAQGVYDADKQLQRLLDYLEQSDTPTIVFFFGDHQPLLGESNNEVFAALSYVHDGDFRQWTMEENYEMWSTPYVMWANYELPDIGLSNMSSFFIGANILEAAGLPKNLYFEFLTQAYKEFNAINYRFFEAKDTTVTAYPGYENRLTLEILNYLQYDTLFGGKYAFEDLCAMEW